MKKLPVVSGKKLIKALRKYGFWVERQKGAHVRLKYKSIDNTLITLNPFGLISSWVNVYVEEESGFGLGRYEIDEGI